MVGEWRVTASRHYSAGFPTEHLTVGTHSENHTEESYPLVFWKKKLIRSINLLKKFKVLHTPIITVLHVVCPVSGERE